MRAAAGICALRVRSHAVSHHRDVVTANPATSEESPRLLLALAPIEIEEFLPEPLSGEIRRMFPNLLHLDVAAMERREWPARLRELRPTILVTCWQTPPLPAELPASLRYVCHLAGSTRSLVSHQHLEAGLLVTNWGGSVARTVAEGALTLVLAALRRVSMWSMRLHRDGGWRRPDDTVHSLFGRRVGLHGFGLTARALVRLLAPFESVVSAFAPGVADAILAQHGVRRAESLDALFANHDVIVELAPLNETTRGSVTERLLRLIPSGGVFVNVARAPIVDEAGLLRVAREGRLQIGLDVHHQEPLPEDSPLRGLANVTLTPHVAGPTNDRRRDSGAFAVRNLRAFLEDRPLEGQVTAEIYDLAT